MIPEVSALVTYRPTVSFSFFLGFAACVALLACAPADQTLVPCADSQAPRYEDVPLASPGVMEPLADATLRGLVQAGVLDYSFVATGGAGTVFLLDARSSRLAVLDSTGRLQYAGGAKGGGPGEIGMAMGATRVRTDSFAVLDRTNARLLLLGPTGAPGRTVTTLSASAGGIATLAGPLGPDSVVILHQSYGMTHPDGLGLDSISLRIVSLADGGVRSLASLPSGRSFKRSRSQQSVSVPVPGDSRTSVLAAAGRLLIAQGAAMQVDVMSATGNRLPGFCLVYRASAVTEALIAADRASDRPLIPAAIRLRMDAHAAAGARLAPAVREIVALDDSTAAVHRWAPRTAADNEYLLVRITNTGLAPYARLRLSGQRRLLGRLGSRFLLLDSSTDEPVLMTIRMAAQPQRAQ